MLKYDLGEMKSENGVALRIEMEKAASEHALTIADMVADMPLYLTLTARIDSPRVLLYFQFAIKDEILPFIRQACVMRWHRRNGIKILRGEEIVRVPDLGILPALKECWHFDDCPLVFVGSFCSYIVNLRLGLVAVKNRLKRVLDKIETPPAKDNFNGAESRSARIACYCAEGLDFSRRTDISWYPGSMIDPGRIVLYFDRKSLKRLKRPLSRSVIDDVEKAGFRWLALEKGVFESQGPSYWKGEYTPKEVLADPLAARGEIEKWVVRTWNRMSNEVYYWRSFYDKFNIRVHFVPHEGLAKSIAQAIAFDMMGERRGILIGRQRSEMYLPLFVDCLGYNPKQVFFVWNERTRCRIEPNRDMMESVVTTGYTYDIAKGKKSLCEGPSSILRSKGVNFVVTLFDNAYGPDYQFSTKNMVNFYEVFLRWVLSDPAAGLVIKSKKPFVIGSLTMIHALLDEAVGTKRCIKLEDVHGVFPSDASFGADMAVGCGISTPVTEAVIGGCRGIHYDMMRLRDHEFYRWGYERIIFDDLNRMMAALKRYRKDKQSEPLLGNWDAWKDQLDSFNDGRGTERMGCYIRWLLEALDKGKSRGEAISAANSLYKERWGQDKVLEMSLP